MFRADEVKFKRKLINLFHVTVERGSRECRGELAYRIAQAQKRLWSELSLN
jgi:hypothetical protein